MMGKFKVRNLMIQVASENDENCPDNSLGQPACEGQSLGGEEEKKKDRKLRPSGCPNPSCKGGGNQGRSNLALLQQELRQALDLGL
jgi:hypothetical protein